MRKRHTHGHADAPCSPTTYGKIDFGPTPYATSLVAATEENSFFRRALWTGCHLQLTLMCVPQGGEIGLEMHSDTDQLLCFQEGHCLVKMGKRKEQFEWKKRLCKDDVVIIPAGWWHNIINAGTEPLKLFSVYGPPNHAHGSLHHTKAEADCAEN